MQKNYYLKDQITDVLLEPGIYRLFSKNLFIVYIGQSVTLRKRLMEHKRTQYMEFEYFDYDFYSREKLDEIENKELEEFKNKYASLPKYNNQAGNWRRSEC